MWRVACAWKGEGVEGTAGVGEGMPAGRAEEVVMGRGWRSRSLGEPPGSQRRS